MKLNFLTCASIWAACVVGGFAARPVRAQETDQRDLAAELTAIQVPQTWSAKLHLMIHVGPYTLDVTGDLTTHNNLVKARLLSGMGRQMVFVKVYTGADGIQWTEVTNPPKRKKVIKLDLRRVAEETHDALAMNLVERLDGSSELGNNLGEDWRELLDLMADDATVTRVASEDGDLYKVDITLSRAALALLDPSGELEKEDIVPTEMIVFIGADDGILRHLVVLSSEPAFSYEAILKDVVINPEVDPASFEYTVPDGIKPEDVTGKVIAKLNGVPYEAEPDDELVY